MVTAWLTSPQDESTQDFVDRLLGGEGVKGVGGFSLVCGKLRKRTNTGKDGLEPLAIVSNRSGSADEVPWIAGQRGEVYGLSNTSYADPRAWPKVEMGKERVLEVVEEVVTAGLGEEELVKRLYGVLDTDTLPEQDGQEFEKYICQLQKSIFIHPISSATALDVPKSDYIAVASTNDKPIANGCKATNEASEAELMQDETPDAKTSNGMTGIYGTQRQTIILVDLEGHVTFRERSLWDSEGKPIERGTGDMRFEFQIEGWNGESKGSEMHSEPVL